MGRVVLVTVALLMLAMSGCSDKAELPTFPPPTATPTAMPKPSFTPSPGPGTAVSKRASSLRPRLFVVVRVTLPSIRAGNSQTVNVESLPEALCALTATDSPGNKTPGLFPKTTGPDGKATWAWTVTSTLGLTRISVRCILGTDEARSGGSFQAYPGGPSV